MNRKSQLLLSIIVMLYLNANFGLAQEIKTSNLYQLKAGNLVLTVDANYGARIVSLKIDQTEFLSGKNVHPENFGSTLWPSPQSAWGWPPPSVLDVMPYTVKKKENGYSFTSGYDKSFPYQFSKQFTANESDTSFSMCYFIKNCSEKNQQVAAWEITRVPGNGITFFAGDPSSITKESVVFSEFKFGLNWFVYQSSPKARKLYIDGEGWLAFANKNGLFVKTFPDNPKGSAAPQEEEVEVYVNESITYIELENQSVYKILKPGEEFSWNVKWYLRSSKEDVLLPSIKLKQEVEKILLKSKQ